MSDTITLKPKWTSDVSDGDVFALKYSKDNSFIASALSNGQSCLYSPTTGRLSYALDQSPGDFPTTALRFHPTSKFFITATADGVIKCWSTRRPSLIWEQKEENNQIFCMDMGAEGKRFVTAGLDTKVRIYDFETQQIISTLERARDVDDDPIPGHTNRVFSLIFDPLDPFLMYSGGWDDTIQVWDFRVGRSIRSLFGPHVCSDSLDIYQKQLAVGSWRTKDQLQIWDLRNYQVSQTFQWKEGQQCLVYGTKFDPTGKFLFAVGSGFNEVGIFSVETGTQIGEPIVLESPVFSLDMSPDGKELIAGETKGRIHCYLIE